MKSWFAIPLWKRVIAALVLGIIAGYLFGEKAESIKWIGDLFIRSIKMLIVPLIFFSLVSGIAALGDLKKLGNVGGKALMLFLFTALVSISLGLTMGTVFEPGVGLNVTLPDGASIPPPANLSWTDRLLALVPENPVMTMA
ncbi:MAG: cation:dicarboxylase symporter family transporter, partial [Marinomonas sp.]